ncbi:MAG: TRAP transporter fused permease subunit [Chloroflexi bacterium]|nr:TRAP transporter fused permease subunit [Chloroflexota bacterium]
MDERKREGSFRRILTIAIAVVAIAMVTYQLIAPFQLFVGPNQHQVIHLTFALVLLFLVFIRRAESRLGIALGFIYLAMSLFFVVYTLPRVPWLEYNSGSIYLPFIVVVMGMIITLLVLEASRQAMGIAIPIVCLVFLAYAYSGQFLPGFLHSPPVEIDRLFLRMGIGSLGTSGIFGPILGVSANVVFLLFVFAALLQTTGAIRFFMEVGKWAGKKLAGGPAMTSVVSSALVGMVTGSPTGNVALTGSFTIPAMKKAGYPPYQAGAIEAAASTGGAIMPPIMGTVAFLMAAITGIPYTKIIMMAAIPAILYYFSAGLYVQFQAMKLKALGKLASLNEEKVDFKEMALGAPLFILPLVLIIALLLQGFSVAYVTVLAIASLVLLSFLRKETRPSLKKWVDGLIDGATTGAGLAAIMAAVGIILGSVSFTVLIQKLPVGLMSLSGGNLLIGVSLAAVANIFLGMGVSTLVAYVMVVLVMAPTLIPLGLSVAQVHLFNLYFANIGFVTPPVAYAALIGARLAGASYLKTAVEASKVASAGFVVPFIFIYAPILILQPGTNPLLLDILLVISAFALILVLQVTICGQYFTALSQAERGMFALIAVALVLSFFLQNYVTIAIGLGVFVLGTAWQWRRRVSWKG